MATTSRPPGATHEVFNQPPPYVGHNLFTDHVALVEALDREGAGWAHERLVQTGRKGGGGGGGGGGGSRSSGAGWPTRTRPSCERTTASATGSTRSSSIRRGIR